MCIRFFLFIAAFFLLHTATPAQETERSHYLFPEFTRATLLMKTGAQTTQTVNYNTLTEEMVFVSRGRHLAIDQEEALRIDTVYIRGRAFFPAGEAFLEKLVVRDDWELHAVHKCRLAFPGSPAAYGGTSVTSSATVYSSLIARGLAYDLELPEDIDVDPYTEYIFRKDEEEHRFVSLRQIRRFYRDQRDRIRSYERAQDVAFDDPQSVRHLFTHMEQND